MNDPTSNREREIRARVDAATPGPWGTVRDLTGTYTIQHGTRRQLEEGFASDGRVAVLTGYEETAYANGSFIARARQDMTWLLDRVANLRTELERRASMLRESREVVSRLRDERDAYTAAAVRCALEDAADDLVAVDPVEWALAGQHAGHDAANRVRTRAAVVAPPAADDSDEATAEHHTVDGTRYLCHRDDHYCPARKCGWNPTTATPDCDFDPDCPVHGRWAREQGTPTQSEETTR
ncbi:hypothetical protein [Streptomyces sp. 8L]|uniref:hypothetical protein n=1 Tax=Streptomyces sp. 8L TaxID=2877242 RepID=UPI001CD768A9|nr:hypothetical protein [Streptomyces sp. 8L]MCA1224105.1 hypothetical protein [Streptomyces sp. 8L]